MTALVSAALSCALIVLLLAFLCGPWQTFCTDWYRQHMFAVRDGVFDLALEGKLTFQDPRYRIIRRALEANIRYAHDMTWLYTLMMALGIRHCLGPKPRTQLKTAIESIECAETRGEIYSLMNLSAKYWVMMVVARSPLLWLVAVLAYLAYCSFNGAREMIKEMAGEAFWAVQNEAEMSDPRGSRHGDIVIQH